MCCRASCRALQANAIRDLRLELRETQTKMLLEELARGELDVVMLALPVEDADIETLRLFDDPFLLAVPRRRTAAAVARVSVATSTSAG